MSTRNPSPPKELTDDLAHADTIGDTTYSKRWLYSLLMRTVQSVQSSPDGHTARDDGITVDELDPELEEQLCCLWDLTVNPDVLPCLEEFRLTSILSELITCQHYPRLMEICVGILANLASNNNECLIMSDDEVFINRILDLFYYRDPYILAEVCRLLHTLLASSDHNGPWLNMIQFQSGFFDNMLFILRSSTKAIRLTDAITREDDTLAEIWCGSELLEAILVAQHQMEWLHGNEVEVIHRLLYTFSSNVNGVAALLKSFDKLFPTFGVYLRKVCEDEPHLIPFASYYNSLRAMVPVMDAVIASLPSAEAVHCFNSDRTILTNLVHVTMGCQQQLADYPALRGVLTDLGILFKDYIKAIEQTFSRRLVEDDPAERLTPSLTDNELDWLRELNRKDRSSLREAFARCCLDDADSGTRVSLIAVCNLLKLSTLLEAFTDD